MRQRKRLHGNYEAGCQNNTLYSPLYLHFSIVQNVLLIPIPYPPSDNSFKFFTFYCQYFFRNSLILGWTICAPE